MKTAGVVIFVVALVTACGCNVVDNFGKFRIGGAVAGDGGADASLSDGGTLMTSTGIGCASFGSALVLAQGAYTINTDDASLLGPSGPIQVTSTLSKTKNGINVAVFCFDEVTSPSGQADVTVMGKNAVALIAHGGFQFDGTLHVAGAAGAGGTGGVAVAGGAAGGAAKTDGAGGHPGHAGSSAPSMIVGGAGGGGAGYQTAGGKGGDSGTSTLGGAGGAADATVGLAGGSGGGGGGNGYFPIPVGATQYALGGGAGGGGGALLISAGESISFAGSIDATGGIGAAGSIGTTMNGGDGAGGGGGGGAGGTIWLEAPTMTLAMNAQLNVAGGAGGTGGAINNTGGGAGGMPGGTSPDGAKGSSGAGGGGGAGAAGRVVMRSALKPSGALTIVSPERAFQYIPLTQP